MFAVSAVSGDAAVSPPPALQLVRKVPDYLWLGLVALLLPIRMFDGAAAAGALVAGSCTIWGVDYVAAAARRC